MGGNDIRLSILLAMQCAPLIKKTGMANILAISHKDAGGIINILKNTGISWKPLKYSTNKVLLYLYRRNELEEYLLSNEVSAFMREYGYIDRDIQVWLNILSDRIKMYDKSKVDFPHELGVFLGYPLCDVKAFISNSGENYAYSGYWKVYENVSDTLKVFKEFDEAREMVISEIIYGKSIQEIAV